MIPSDPDWKRKSCGGASAPAGTTCALPRSGRLVVGPAERAVGRQLVEGRGGGRAEVDLAVDDRRRGVDHADLRVRPPGREPPFLHQLAGIGPADRRLGRVVPRAGEVVVVHRPVAGVALRGRSPRGRSGRRPGEIPASHDGSRRSWWVPCWTLRSLDCATLGTGSTSAIVPSGVRRRLLDIADLRGTADPNRRPRAAGPEPRHHDGERLDRDAPAGRRRSATGRCRR